MMGTKEESERELFARRIIENKTFIPLSSNEDGTSGKVDYISPDSEFSIAVEVTSHTNQDRSNLVNGNSNFTGIIPAPGVAHNWLVQTRDFPNVKTIQKLVVPELHTFSVHGITDYFKHHHEWWMGGVPTLTKAVAALNSARVESLKRLTLADAEHNYVAELYLLPSINWKYGGPDSALDLIEKVTLSKEDNRKKLRESGMQNRHLFVILDKNTDREVMDAFNSERQLLPSRPPHLPEEITHLWLVDFETELGWYFEPIEGWQLLK